MVRITPDDDANCEDEQEIMMVRKPPFVSAANRGGSFQRGGACETGSR